MLKFICMIRELFVSLKVTKTLTHMEKEWEIRPYFKNELAQAYAPEISQKAAVNRLSLWIKLNNPLFEALLSTGYQSNQRVFTSRQVELIFKYLGEP